MNESSDQLAVDETCAPRLTAGPLDQIMIEIHATQGPIGSAVSQLVPYPCDVPFAADAKATTVTVSATATGEAAVLIRYRTEHALEAVASSYSHAFTAAGVALDDPLAPAARLAIVRGRSGENSTAESGDSSASCRVTIDDHDDMRLVRVAVDYGDFDASALLADHADWHHGAAPIDLDRSASVDSFEIKTIDNTPRPSFSTLYTTRYRLAGTTLSQVRLRVEHRLREAGWTWLEPTPNVLYLDGPFAAETHICQAGDDVLLDFVGEFGPFPNRSA